MIIDTDKIREQCNRKLGKKCGDCNFYFFCTQWCLTFGDDGIEQLEEAYKKTIEEKKGEKKQNVYLLRKPYLWEIEIQATSEEEALEKVDELEESNEGEFDVVKLVDTDWTVAAINGRGTGHDIF